MAVGVVIVTYNAAEIIADCLESLMASEGADLRIVVVDNASLDGTVAAIRAWAEGSQPWDPTGKPFRPLLHGRVPLALGEDAITALAPGDVGLIRKAENGGFASGVNAGLRSLMAMPEIEFFWILNPDCMAENATARHLVGRARAAGRFGIIGGRVYYTSPPLMIQTDGGRIDLSSGTCIPFNLGKVGRDTAPPLDSTLDYVAGTHMFVSRDFIDTAGLMPENYFLYYEEMDWCLRRGDLPLLACAEAAVHHHGGHTVGSATMASGPSSLSAFFMARSRMKFMRRWRPFALPYAWTYAMLKAMRCLWRGQNATATAMLRGLCGFGPTPAMLARIGRKALPS